MAETGIFLIGGSAGSINILMQVLPELDPNVSFPIVITLHRKAYPQSALDDLFNTSSKMPVFEADDKMELEKGKIYLVPADYHLLFEDAQTISLDASEKINYSRPSIDVTFSSGARVFGKKTAALLLSGGNSDGVEGLKAIIQHQGLVCIQNPTTAEVDYMPRKALEEIEDATILRPEQMARFINELKNK